MIKGVNKNVIEIKDTGNAYFEKAVLYINPDYNCRDDHFLRTQADKYLNSIKNTKYKKVKKSKFPVAITIFSAVALIGMILFFYI